MDGTLQFILIVLALEVTPGPAVLMILFQSSLGMRHVLAALAGLLSANVVWIALVATGLGVIVTQSPQLYRVLQIVGAMYLVYLGVKIIRHGIQPPDMSEGRAYRRLGRSYLKGMLTSFSNPKALVFFMALFPPFARAEHFVGDVVFLGMLKMLCMAVVQVGYGLTGQRIFGFLGDGKAGIWIKWILGGGIVLAGVGLVVG